ncbi:hypothetical protein [Streptomyces fractus]|uniref:hypothetical protein n=1 Tax=Streptomyces fractus TaxID=641806 RepID=UPI003CE9F251
MVDPHAGEITGLPALAQSGQPDQRVEVYELRDDPDGERTRVLLGTVISRRPSG